MDEDKRKSVALAIFLGSIIFIAAIFLVWTLYVNKGKVAFYGPSPFEITDSNGKKTQCNVSPCVIKQKPGVRNLIVSKAEYESMLIEVEVKRWKTTEFQIEFKIKPYLSSTDRMPENDKEDSYEILFEDKTKMYKLINSNDLNEKALIYFQNEIKSPTIFASQNTALIIEKGTGVAYMADIKKGERKRIDDFYEEIVEGKWSGDGEYFAYTKENSNYIWILDKENEKTQTQIDKNKSRWTWTYDSKLLFVTSQLSSSTGGIGPSGENYINLTGETEDNLYIFGMYHPLEKAYTKIDESSEIASLPEKLVPTSNGSLIYFQIGENMYKLHLK
jgi:hypothetical protein